MSTVFQYDNDNGTNGNVLTTGLSGYTSMTGTDPTYDNSWSINGALSAKYVCAGTLSNQRKDLPVDVTNTYWRRYFKIGIPSSTFAVCGIYDSASVHLGDVRLQTDGKIQLRSAASSSLAVSTHAFAAGDQVRIEYHPIIGGTSTVRLFYGANLHGTTADETLTGANGTAGTGLINNVREGVQSSTTVTMWADATLIDNAAYPGPIATPPTVFAAAGTIPVFSTTQGNPTTIAAGGPVATPSLTLQEFRGAILATNGVGLLTNAARWGWSPGGYDVPDSGSFVPEGAAMRINWDPTPGTIGNGIQVGRFVLDTAPLVAGHRIKVKIVVNVPVGSPDVSLINPFTDTQTDWMTVKGRDVELVLFLTWDVGRNPMIGLQAHTGTGSVLVKRVHLVDISSPAGDWYPVGGTVLPPPPPTDTTAPTTPGTPTASISSQQVILAWTASTDAVGVDHYELHRSASTGFTPSGGTLLALPPTNGWTDNAVPVGTWYYKVIAVDAAGNKSTASGQRQAITSAPAVTTILPMIATANGFEGINDWPGYRVYNSGSLAKVLNSTGDSAGQARPQLVFYSKQGNPFSGSYSTIFAQVLSDLNGIYYVGGATSQTPSANKDVKLVWSNGNENFDKGMLSGGATSPANVALYVESQRALYDACHYIDPATGQRRFPNAMASTNPTTFAELNNDVAVWLHPAARYCDVILWSGYPPGRTNTNTDPTYNWDSMDPADYNNSSLGFLTRCYRRTSLARAQARTDTGDPTREISIGFGEVGIPSDPHDNRTRPYYLVFGIFGTCALIGAQYAMTTLGISYWNDTKAGGPHNILHDEGSASDHATGQANPNPSTAVTLRNWTSYHPSFGGTKAASWTSTPVAGWKHTGTQL